MPIERQLVSRKSRKRYLIVPFDSPEERSYYLRRAAAVAFASWSFIGVVVWGLSTTPIGHGGHVCASPNASLHHGACPPGVTNATDFGCCKYSCGGQDRTIHIWRGAKLQFCFGSCWRTCGVNCFCHGPDDITEGPTVTGKSSLWPAIAALPGVLVALPLGLRAVKFLCRPVKRIRGSAVRGSRGTAQQAAQPDEAALGA